MPAIRYGSGNTDFNTPASFDPGAMDFYGTLTYDALYHSPVGTYGLFGGPEGGVQRSTELGLEKHFGSGNMLEPEIAQERYGLNGALTFDEPIDESAAKLMHSRKSAEQRREYLLGNGSEHGGIFRNVTGFGVGMAASMIDPVNFSSMFVPIVGQSKLMSGGKATMGLMTTAQLARHVGANRTRIRLASGAIEGFVGMAAVEPLVLAPAIYEQSNYGVENTLINLTAGVLFGAGAHFGIGKMNDMFKRLGDELNPMNGYDFDPETDLMAFKSAVSEVLQDEPVTSPAEVYNHSAGQVWQELKADIIKRSLPEVGEHNLRQSRLGYELLRDQLEQDINSAAGERTWNADEIRAEATKELGPDLESVIARELQDLPLDPVNLTKPLKESDKPQKLDDIVDDLINKAAEAGDELATEVAGDFGYDPRSVLPKAEEPEITEPFKLNKDASSSEYGWHGRINHEPVHIFRDTEQFGYAVWYRQTDEGPVQVGYTKKEAIETILNEHRTRDVRKDTKTGDLFDHMGMEDVHVLQDILNYTEPRKHFKAAVAKLAKLGFDLRKAEVRIGSESVVFMVDNHVIKMSLQDLDTDIKGITSKDKLRFKKGDMIVTVSEKVKAFQDKGRLKSESSKISKDLAEAFKVFGDLHGFGLDDAFIHNMGIDAQGRFVLFDKGRITKLEADRLNVIKATVKKSKLNKEARAILDQLEAQHAEAKALDPEYDAKMVKKEIQKRLKALIAKKRRQFKSTQKKLDTLREIPKARESQLLGSPIKETPEPVERTATPETVKKKVSDTQAESVEIENILDPESLTPDELKILEKASELTTKADTLTKAVKKGAACITAKAL